MLTKVYYVYIMTRRPGVFYAGVTNDPVRRVLEHREGKCGFTSKYRLNRLVYLESTNDVREAIAFEKRLKRWPRVKKVALIRLSNPRFLDLAEKNGVATAGLGRGARHMAIAGERRSRLAQWAVGMTGGRRWRGAKKVALIKLSNPRFLDLAERMLGLPPLTSAGVLSGSGR